MRPRMNDTLSRELQARIEAFAGDITAILQRAVADSVRDVLGATSPSKSSSKKGAPVIKRPVGRPPKVFDTSALLREITRSGGRRMEQIGKSMGKPTKTLVRPMKRLLQEKKVKRKGKARGTTYTAS